MVVLPDAAALVPNDFALSALWQSRLSQTQTIFALFFHLHISFFILLGICSAFVIFFLFLFSCTSTVLHFGSFTTKSHKCFDSQHSFCYGPCRRIQSVFGSLSTGCCPGAFLPNTRGVFVDDFASQATFCAFLPFSLTPGLFVVEPGCSSIWSMSWGENLLSNMSQVIFTLMDQCNNFVCFAGRHLWCDDDRIRW